MKKLLLVLLLATLAGCGAKYQWNLWANQAAPGTSTLAMPIKFGHYWKSEECEEAKKKFAMLVPKGTVLACVKQPVNAYGKD